MKRPETIHIAIAETSVIIRSGLAAALKRLPDLTVHPIELTSPEALQHCMQGHQPDILIVNPTFGGWFNVGEFRAACTQADVKCIALLSSVADINLLKAYDENIGLYDDLETLSRKLTALLGIGEEEPEANTLSQREKEVLCCVVRGMTNKEIADQLFLSIHTVITHRRNIARKLQIHSPAGLTIYAIVNKLVDISEVNM